MKTKSFFNKILWIFAALFLSVFCIFQGLFTQTVKAEETSVLAFDKTNVMTDLQGMTIDGKPFDITDYAFDETRDVQVISFIEYCYTYHEDKQDNFGLYVYVWNPKGLTFVNDTVRNQIQFTYGEYYDVPVEYPISILNKSETSGYEGMFYKLKIVLSEEEKTYILSSLNSVSRTYHVSGIELLQSGKAVADNYSVATTFTYSGFSAGYGSNDATENTLTCTRDGSEVLELDVHHTYYRPNGSNGTNSYTQDTLMSVYFSIPNSMSEMYDRLSGVECSWIKARTDWIYLTGNKAVYNEFMKYIGKTELFDDGGTKYDLLDDVPLKYGFRATSVEGQNIVKYNYSGESALETLGRLDYCFYDQKGTINSSDNYLLSGEEILQWMQAYHELYANKNDKYLLVDGAYYAPYSATLFEKSKANTTQVKITADDEYSLTETVISANWWQKIGGGASEISSTEFNGIAGLKKVSSLDMAYSPSELSDLLYISPDDVSDFVSFYNEEIRKGRTVYLLRYDIGEYECLEAVQGEPDNSGFVVGFDNADTNARVFREHVYWNFDIIYAEFETNGNKVIIPVVANPIDIVSDSTPALDTTDDNKDDWLADVLSWMIGLGLIGLLVVVVVCFCPWIISIIGKTIVFVVKQVVNCFLLILKGLWFIIKFPVNLIKKIFHK